MQKDETLHDGVEPSTFRYQLHLILYRNDVGMLLTAECSTYWANRAYDATAFYWGVLCCMNLWQDSYFMSNSFGFLCCMNLWQDSYLIIWVFMLYESLTRFFISINNLGFYAVWIFDKILYLWSFINLGFYAVWIFDKILI